MQESTWQALDSFFREFPIFRAEPVDLPEIEDASRTLGIRFAREYIEFVMRYGGGIVGPYPIFGLRHAEAVSDDLWSVVDATEHFRAQQWPGASSWHVVSMDHAGNPIGATADGRIMTFDHDAGAEFDVAPDFEGFLVSNLARTGRAHSRTGD